MVEFPSYCPILAIKDRSRSGAQLSSISTRRRPTTLSTKFTRLESLPDCAEPAMAQKTEKKTIPVAPRPVAKVTFTIRYKASGAPAKDVQLRGDNMTGAAAERVWPNKGKTNALGK